MNTTPLPVLVFSGDEARQARAELDQLFGSRKWHSFTRCERDDGQALCYWCGAPESARARVNIWGTVCDVGACAACHLVNHGKLKDTL